MTKHRQSSFRHPLDDVLGTISCVRVLRSLILHGAPQNPSALADRTALTKPAVGDALTRLVAHDLVEPVGTGRYVTYRLRDSHFLAPRLKTLFRQEEAREEQVFGALEQIAKEADPSPVAVWLYGSVARGTDRPDSDFDVVIVAESPQHRGLLEDVFRKAVVDLEDAWSLPPVSVVVVTTEEARKGWKKEEDFYVHLREDAVPVYGKLRTEVFSHG